MMLGKKVRGRTSMLMAWRRLFDGLARVELSAS
jgi:hypothetical protein